MDKIKLDLGCGTRKRAGYVGLDRTALPGVDIVCDADKGIPLGDNSVEAVYSNYFLEHVDDLIFLFQEL